MSQSNNKEDTYKFATSPLFNLIVTVRRRLLRYLCHVLFIGSERHVLKALMALSKGRPGYPPGCLFMEEGVFFL